MILYNDLPESLHIYGVDLEYGTPEEFFQVQEFVDSEDEHDYIVLKSTLTDEEQAERPDSRLIEVLEKYPKLWHVPWIDAHTGEEIDKLEVARRMIDYLFYINQPLSTVNAGHRERS